MGVWQARNLRRGDRIVFLNGDLGTVRYVLLDLVYVKWDDGLSTSLHVEDCEGLSFARTCASYLSE
jgi:hypothetical protein